MTPSTLEAGHCLANASNALLNFFATNAINHPEATVRILCTDEAVGEELAKLLATLEVSSKVYAICAELGAKE